VIVRFKNCFIHYWGEQLISGSNFLRDSNRNLVTISLKEHMHR